MHTRTHAHAQTHTQHTLTHAGYIFTEDTRALIDVIRFFWHVYHLSLPHTDLCFLSLLMSFILQYFLFSTIRVLLFFFHFSFFHLLLLGRYRLDLSPFSSAGPQFNSVVRFCTPSC